MSARLVELMRQGPLWCSPPSVERDANADTLAAGVDLTWYVRRYHQSLFNQGGELNCLQDYTTNVRRLARSPNMVFDEAWYRHRYPEVDQDIKCSRLTSGWEHYLFDGACKGYNPAFWFDERWYRKRYWQAQSAINDGSVTCGLEHYLRFGLKEDLSPSVYFNSEWYRGSNMANVPQGRVAYPIVHYLRSRPPTRASASPLFDAAWYSGQYLSTDDQADRSFSPFEHYILIGRRLTYSPSPHFNELAYRNAYPEINELVENGTYESGLEHYVDRGLQEGYVAFSHLENAGADYSSPAFLDFYERSITLNIKQLARFRSVVEGL